MNLLTTYVSVCFSGLTKLQALTLNKELADVDYFPQSDCHAPSTKQNPAPIYTAILPLRSEVIDDVMSFYIKQQLTIEQCRIQISIPTQVSGTKPVFTVPPIVNHMLIHLNCGLVVMTE
ncbi:hypothetical protein PULV_a2985 [Pseudoalteromonas ulvae UL12]|uniref:hypothetical protein n=1 Tax=Pseudoalteromonas ulvae TaxID=107327 RepID=UPI00186B7CAD|nr:hypothetical protein [Pseudoalteromonas ulvae]MBE0362367.1 hypothetical protein [Pseudoalteromonas ulvae UL12]